MPRPCPADTKVLVGRRVPAREHVAIDNIDHAAWDRLLKKYVDEQGLVDYAGWKRSKAEMAALDAYLEQLSKADAERQAAAAGRLAFWINAYNAMTIKGILREYPTTSIRNHTKKEGFHIWKHLLLIVGADAYSLDDMEHQVLRKMSEPRIHFAIVCASRGCPRLRNEAYTASRLDKQLTENAKAFFANLRHFRHDASAGQFHLSSILNWFARDFGRTQAEQLRAIAPYLPTEAARSAALSGTVRVRYLDYDWSLNEQAD